MISCPRSLSVPDQPACTFCRGRAPLVHFRRPEFFKLGGTNGSQTARRYEGGVRMRGFRVARFGPSEVHCRRAGPERQPCVAFRPGAIHGDGRAGGELPDRCVPDLRHQTWAHFPGSGTIPAQGLDRRPGTVRGRGDLRGPGVQDQAGTGDGHAGPSLDTGAPARWVTGDAVYGQYHRLRRTLEERGLHYLLVVPVSQRVIVKDGTVFGTEKRADAAVAGLRPTAWRTAWRTRSAGERPKGVRDYAWARMRINGAKTDTRDTGCSSAGPWPSPERSRVSSAAPEARRPGGNGPHRRGTVGH